MVRESGSKVTIRDNVNPALRAVDDIFALIKDDRLPDEIRARVLPGLFRIAVESAAKQAYLHEAIDRGPRAIRVRGRMDVGEEDRVAAGARGAR